MAFQKGKERTGGRKRGTPNKATMAVKQAFQHAFDHIGGADNLAKWARKNESDFYKLYARLIPQDPTELVLPVEPTIKLSTDQQRMIQEELCRMLISYVPVELHDSIEKKILGDL